MAYLLATREFRGKRVLEVLIDLPMVLPPTVAGVALLTAFGRTGLAGQALGALGITLPFTTLGVVVAQAFVAAPFFVGAARAGFAEVDRKYLDAAATLRAAPGYALSRGCSSRWPRPRLLAGAAMSWARALGEFGATITFAGNMPGVTQTMPLAVYLALQSDLDAAIALSVLLLLVSLTVLLAIRLSPLAPRRAGRPCSTRASLSSAARSRSTSRSRRAPAAPRCWWARAARARPRCCGCSPGSTGWTTGCVALGGGALRRRDAGLHRARLAARRSATSRRTTRCSPTCRCSRTWRSASAPPASSAGGSAPWWRRRSACWALPELAGRALAPAVGRAAAARRARPRAGAEPAAAAARRAAVLARPPDPPRGSRASCAALLQRLACVTVYVTHSPVEALVFGDQIVVLEQGRVAQAGHARGAAAATPLAVRGGAGRHQPVRRAAGHGRATSSCRPFGPRRASSLVEETPGSGRRVPDREPARDHALSPHCPRPARRTSSSARFARSFPSRRRGERVRVVLDARPTLVAEVTREAVAALDLQEGMRIHATFKATGVHVYA